jgi:hypothetical protein
LLARGVLSCARGCGLLYLLSAEGDDNQFPYKEDAHRDVVQRTHARLRSAHHFLPWQSREPCGRLLHILAFEWRVIGPAAFAKCCDLQQWDFLGTAIVSRFSLRTF